MDFPYYPINDFGPAMKGMIIGGLGIFHVFLAQFAIGGGMLMAYFQWLGQTGRSEHTRSFIDGFFKLLVLISFVLGAVTGVGMWFTSIQISPRTIGVMVEQFHWFWAIEWTFFCLEIVSGYLFYRYASRLPDKFRFRLLLVYSAAAWFSLFWINGILSWQLTPGAWESTGNAWRGFFNPSFFPSLIFRTISCMAIAALVACIIINMVPDLTREVKQKLINKAAHFLFPMILMPLLGLWYFSSIPDDSRAWITGGSAAMSMFLAMAIGASVLIGGYAVFAMIRQKLYINGATATLLTVLAFAASAAGESVREGVRKPYTIREYLYSNSVKESEIAQLREVGCVEHDPYPLIDDHFADTTFANPQLERGAKVFRFQCSICHTVSGVNGLTHLTESWSVTQQRLNISQLQRTKPFMPPFAGNAEDVESLVQWIRWTNAERPSKWKAIDDPVVREQIRQWLEEVGTTPGTELVKNERP